MNPPVTILNRQIPAQNLSMVDWRSCDAGKPCQSRIQAVSISPLSAMVCRNHYPSPSSARFTALATEPGLFFAICTAFAANSGKFYFGNSVNHGKLVANNNTTRGSQRCRSANSSWGQQPLSCWQDASGTTYNAPVSARQRVRWSRKRPAATFLPVLSSARALVRCAMMSACAFVTDKIAASRGTVTSFQPAGFAPGGLFYANLHEKLRGGSARRAHT